MKIKFAYHGPSLISALALLGLVAHPAHAQLQVVATTPTYASLASQLGGDRVTVQSLMTGPENIHNIVATPSKMLAVSDADLFIHSGLDLELWVPLLLRGSRNTRIQPGQPGNVNTARGIRLKEVPTEISRSQGDMHIYGNPHYQLDPVNVILIARTIRDALKQADPTGAADFDRNYDRFEEEMKKKLVEWLRKMQPYRGAKVVAYHLTFPYIADRFGFEVIGHVEPKPGIEPSPGHIAELVNHMREANCKVLLLNTWGNRATAQAVAQRAGAEIVVFPEWVGGVEGADDCVALFDYLVDSIIEALERTGTAPAGAAATEATP